MIGSDVPHENVGTNGVLFFRARLNNLWVNRCDLSPQLTDFGGFPFYKLKEVATGES